MSVRYFRYAKSRAAAVPKDVLSDTYPGLLVSNFYSGYSFHWGLHPRCWVHCLRDFDALEAKHPTDVGKKWVQGVRTLYGEARAFASENAKERAAARWQFQQRLTRTQSATLAPACRKALWRRDR